MSRNVLRSPNTHALNDALIYDDTEFKRPAREVEIYEAKAVASTDVSSQYPQRSRALESSLITVNQGVLRPPNSHTLNDAVIYGTVEAKRPARNIELAKVQYPQHCRTSEHVLSTELARTHLGEHGAAVAINRPITTSRMPSLMNTEQQTLTSDSRDATAITIQTMPETVRSSNPYEATIQQVIAERERIRTLRRERQIRYRKKKHEYMLSLEAETKILRERIKILSQRKSALSAIDATQQNVWNVAVEYFKLFRYGLSANGQSSTSKGSTQLDFLRSSMSPDVIFNAQQGIETMITSWKYITYAFQALEIELDSLVRSVDGSLVATTTTSVSISGLTIRNVFPHLCSGEDEDLHRLAGKIVGHRFHLDGVTRFEWDAASRRVSAVISQSDMLTPMLCLLGNLDDVSRVFYKSHISSDFQWK
ncbi:hypothetical protein L915_14685 [Phytophthora nicotianae]|uniref:BZIP domain-containing protein n=3 Tax=Phytophthora nicotianae TaxID=4792 RepID=W2PSK5_PHYN3|nr:hypothetical protein PPTG_15245 [Phytophthora nicotianae INRA-310]ETI39266.1 hypothetical protein F443_15137 [Phytophthora nicotianae P1569]ETK79469.1 hypothetical protein L915_14685 [Phytophthora nicotianae]KUF75889.1 hypothetical protein AM587_10015711 [Phytophthora nicotianae]ETM39311.1 hypothetical protein L914_14536 [Phytophthora nicotianae]ETN03928.1 hypothetical protein PPTG_15245 [Phytophthora nicotianae INRA-310]